MQPRTIADYGGPRVNAIVVRNPQSQISDTYANREQEDVAQLTRTGYRAIVEFKTNLTTDPPASDVTVRSMWGSSSAQKPAITRDGAGLYTLVFPLTFTDDIGVVETVSFLYGHCSVRKNDNSDYAAQIKSIVNNEVNIKVIATGVGPADLSGTGYVTVWLV